MAISLTANERTGANPAPWRSPELYWANLDRVTEGEDPPFGVLQLDALRFNAHDMIRRASGTPIRIASKSVRVRSILDAALALPGFDGVLAYTLPEALWLAESIDDVVVGYPTAHRGAIAQLAESETLASRVTLMVDSPEHLDVIDAVVPPEKRPAIQVCLELDASWDAPAPLGRLGTWRSPIHSPQAARSLAEYIVERPGFELVGMMAYEGQIAGVPDQAAGKAAMNTVVSWVKRRSRAELMERRGEAVALVRDVADLRFVNGGGTGSLESTSNDDSVTEIAAGSGLFAGHLFDGFEAFDPAPAASFALPVVRKPRHDMATILGGGWIASGPPGEERLPKAVWPEGLRMMPREMAGEVQTPVEGGAAASLALGDRVWFRHNKSGELSERLNEFLVVDSEGIVDRVPTYRGEGKAFL
ncbi:amino acid deaminase/aldolase [Paramicrobacterium agarici]|uniref:D-serine deaminase-like pyridoxal phosphate-dependent protein n=1 Tax=Paramicrobacterium agarici TaxID=630514 RepID=A0A2A9DZL1_9MICO|nr:amino acid deaminase/aldolase [Microbacterium agarici]PFG31771.1 D-serine deaminase-like pyridoxal phosphate-dependent protein [Microbacterium agarici]